MIDFGARDDVDMLNGKIMSPRIMQGASLPFCVRAEALADCQEWQGYAFRIPDLIHGFANAPLGSGSWSNNVDTFDACYNLVQTTISNITGFAQSLGVKVIPIEWAIPLATNTQTMAAVAAGTYDDVFTAMFSAILAHRTDANPILIRPGWEAGYPTAWPWSATQAGADGANYVSAFQRVVGLARAVSSRFKVEWVVAPYCTNSGGTVIDPTTTFYPGNAYVEAVGCDIYNKGDDIGNNTLFDDIALSSASMKGGGYPYGPQYLMQFARANGKLFTIPEAGSGSDNPGWWRSLAAFVYANRDIIPYLGVWNKNAGAGFNCRLSNKQHPRSADVFKDVFFGKGENFTEQSETSLFCLRTTRTATLSSAVYNGDGTATLTFPAQARAPRAGTWLNLAGSTGGSWNNNWRILASTVSNATISTKLSDSSSPSNPGTWSSGGTLTFENEPSDAVRAAIDRLHATLKRYGLLGKVDEIYVSAGADNDISRLGIKLPGGGLPGYQNASSRKLSIVGSPSFVANRGWAGTGSASDYLSTGINLSTAVSPKATQNGFHISAWYMDAPVPNGAATSWDVGQLGLAIGVNASGFFTGQPGLTSSKTISAGAAAAGHILINRTGASAWRAYKDGVDQGINGTDAAAAFQNRILFVGAASGVSGGVNRIGCFTIGAPLTVNQYQNDVVALYSAVRQYLIDVGQL